MFNLFSGVPLSIWYDWKNDGPDASEREHNFGTVTQDLKPKPAYVAAQTLTRELAGFRVVERHPTGNDADFILVLKNAAGETKLAAWTMAQAHAVTLEVGGAATRRLGVVTGNGERRELDLDAGRLAVNLEATPQYVALESGASLKTSKP